MLLAQNFISLVAVNLKLIPCIAVLLHKFGKSNTIDVDKDLKFLWMTWLSVPYSVVMIVQWVHAWWSFTVPTILLSLTFSIGVANMVIIPGEHYR